MPEAKSVRPSPIEAYEVNHLSRRLRSKGVSAVTTGYGVAPSSCGKTTQRRSRLVSGRYSANALHATCAELP
jgi:hypothetical protein